MSVGPHSSPWRKRCVRKPAVSSHGFRGELVVVVVGHALEVGAVVVVFEVPAAPAPENHSAIESFSLPPSMEGGMLLLLRCCLTKSSSVAVA